MRPDEPQHAEPQALTAARDRFDDLAAQFDNTKQPLQRHERSIVDGAGQFSGDVGDGALAFMLSWQTVFDVASDSAGLIAGNIGAYTLDLEAVDKDLTVTIQL
ncbi:hypothetical protein [Angustibacter aerolatus]